MPSLTESMDRLIARSFDLVEGQLEPHHVKELMGHLAHHEKMMKHHEGEMHRRAKLARVATNIGQHAKAAEHTQFAATHGQQLRKHKLSHQGYMDTLEKHYNGELPDVPEPKKPEHHQAPAAEPAKTPKPHFFAHPGRDPDYLSKMTPERRKQHLDTLAQVDANFAKFKHKLAKI